MSYYQRWEPYVPVAERRAAAAREASRLAKKGKQLRPIHISSRSIATSFWGLAWCNNLENYADWSNRLPRGRTYARNGSIVDLQITAGEITALVSGSSLYKIKIAIDKLAAKKWKAIRSDCSQQVSSILDLMRGKLPEVVLKRLTEPKTGMFPSPKELKMRCSCPDSATLCKHLAATLYAVGHLLDTEPELFFKMRGVDQSELVSTAMTVQNSVDAIGLEQHSDLAGEDLGAIFGIDLASSAPPPAPQPEKSKSTPRGRRSSSTVSVGPAAAPLGSRKSTAAKPAAVTKTAGNKAEKILAAKKSPPKKVTVKKVPAEKVPVKEASSKNASDKKTSIKKASGTKLKAPA